ncbi:MAG: hypothetical protein ACOX6N_05420 [Patescibacteria group bacterium]|jgi:hypothetical protein
MSKQFIYATDIKPPKTLIGLLDGSEQFCFENPYFNVAGMTKPDKKTFLEVKGTNSKFGVMLNQIYILFKGANNVFTKYYAIGYTETVHTGSRIDKKPKEYYVMKPFDVSDLGRSNKYKLIVSPAKGEIFPEDLVLLKLDYQFSMVMDVLCISKILDIDLSKYSGMNNEKFYKAYIGDINEIIKEKGAKKLMEYDEILVTSFDDIPTFGKSSRGETIPIYDLENNMDPAFDTLFMSFYDSISSIKSKLRGWEKVLQRPNCAAFPSIRYMCFEKKDSDGEIEYVKRYDGRFMFIIQLSPGDSGYNPKFPEGLVTRQQVSRTKIDKLTKNSLSKLWGGAMSDDEKYKGATQRGCLFVVPQPIYRYYEKGNPTIDWRVEKVATQRIQMTAMVDYDEGYDFLGDVNINDNNDEIGGDDGAEFIGNEEEIDPSAFN